MRNEEWLTPMGIIAYSSEYLQERGGHGGLSLSPLEKVIFTKTCH